jgi:VWFA-related protein
MRMRWMVWIVAGASAAVLTIVADGQTAGASTQTPTFQVTSKLVFLDVTVLDKKGKPVTAGLTRDDFTITENRQPQPIFSFEAPDTHALQNGASAENPDGKAPRTILVLDQLNSSFQDFAYIRWEVNRFLESQPKELPAPTEMMVAANDSLELVQNYTRNRDDLLEALRELPPGIPYKLGGAFYSERLEESFDMLQQIALENGGVPGRKNILWAGHGGPGVNTVGLDFDIGNEVQQYAHMVTNLLVDARISLFVIYPGLPVAVRNPFTRSVEDAEMDIADGGPFATTGDVNFGLFVDETGGKLFYNRNDVDEEMREAERMGSEYYTLTYQPHGGDDDGRFRRIRVTMRNPNLRAVTKAGYYAPDRKAPADPHAQLVESVVEAARSTIPFTALDVSISDLVRHPDTQTAQFTARLRPGQLSWQPADNGRSVTNLAIAAASLSEDRRLLTSKLQWMTIQVNSQNLAKVDTGPAIPVSFTLRIPKHAKSVRVVMETETGNRIGAAEVSRKAIDAAPAEPTPQPQLNGPRAGTPSVSQ